MHKQKKPCECRHKAGKHEFRGRQTAPSFFSSLVMTKNFLVAGHTGKCRAEGCDCKKFKEQK